MNITYGSDKILSIEAFDKKQYPGIYYESGYFSDIKHGAHVLRYSKKDLEKGTSGYPPFIVEDNKVYYKPYVKVIFINNSEIIMPCNSFSKAKKLKETLVRKFLTNPFSPHLFM